MISENIKMALRSIWGNRLRSILTMLGIIIGVGAVVAITSLGQGLKQVVTKQVGDLGANVLVLTSGKLINNSGSQGGGGRGQVNPASSIGTSTLTEEDVKTVQNNPDISDSTLMSIISGLVTKGDKTHPTALILGTTPSYITTLKSQKVEKGRFLQDSDQGKYVAVIGPATRDELFGIGADALGQKISVRGQEFTIIGVMKGADQSANSSLSGGTGFDDVVLIPTDTAKALTKTNLQIYRIIAQAKSNDQIQPAVDSLNREIKKNHGGQDDFSVLTQKDILSTFDTILTALTGAISSIAAISLLVGGIGIMNIMLVSVTERTREIGLRKAVGATSNMVLMQFMMEALVLTLLGGLMGVGFAFLMGTAVGSLAKLTPVFTMSTIILAFSISALIGLIFGIAPAIKAARMKPIEALRYE